MKWIDTLCDALIAKRIRKSARPLGWSSPKAIGCWTCNISHTLPPDLRQGIASAEGFFSRHERHSVNWFEQPALAGLWTPNADIKEAYGASAAYAIVLTSLATDAALLAGRAGTAVSNTSNLYRDYSVGGVITMGSVAATLNKTIEIWMYASRNDTPTYPDSITGTDANKTMTSANVKSSGLLLFHRIFVDTTTARPYPISARGLAVYFGGLLPKNHGLFVVQDSGQALSATAGDHILSYTGVFNTVI